jgi:CBS domain-containing protein
MNLPEASAVPAMPKGSDGFLPLRAVSRLPVVDQAGHLVGIVSQVDVLGIFSRPDQEIRRDVTDRLLGQGFPMDPERLQVTVRDGIVTLFGRPEIGQAGRDIIEAVRNFDGVVAVQDQLDPADDRLHTGTS